MKLEYVGVVGGIIWYVLCLFVSCCFFGVFLFWIKLDKEIKLICLGCKIVCFKFLDIWNFISFLNYGDIF